MGLPSDIRFDSSRSTPVAIAEKPTEPIAKVQVLDWPAEPKCIEDLLANYNVDCKATGRWPGTTLYLVESKGRNGKIENVTDNQTYKLFLAPCLN